MHIRNTPVLLHHVYEVEFILSASSGVGYAEVEPLSVAPRVDVWLANQVVFVGVDLECTPEVGAFETRFKHQGLVMHACILEQYVSLT